MTRSPVARARHLLTVAAGLAIVAATCLGLIVVQAGPAAAAGPIVSVSPATGLNPDYASTLTLSGTGFQDIDGGFSGIYVLFGWVDANWQPSAGGVSGKDYVYVEDEQTKDNHGYIKFVSYSDGATLSAANGGIITPQGTWSTTLIVPGSTFPASGENGQITQINCLQVQCGVITIGAHGVVDPQNETFTPVDFAPTVTAPAPPPAAAAVIPPPAAAPTPTTTPAPTTTVAPTPTTTTAPTAPSTTVPVKAKSKAGDPLAVADARDVASSHSSGGDWWIAAPCAAFLAAVAALWYRRRRHRATT